MMSERRSTDYLNGVPELLVLALLARRPMYGYELVQAIKIESGGVLEFGEGLIYPLLHRLEDEGLLAARRESVGGRSRVVYRTTATGRKRLQSAEGSWRAVAQAVQSILAGPHDARPAMA